MTPGNIETLLTILGILSLTGLGLVGLKIVLNAWVRRKELAGGGDVASLSESVEALRADTEELRDRFGTEVADLHERVDFAERLLARGSFKPEGRGAGEEETPV